MISIWGTVVVDERHIDLALSYEQSSVVYQPIQGIAKLTWEVFKSLNSSPKILEDHHPVLLDIAKSWTSFDSKPILCVDLHCSHSIVIRKVDDISLDEVCRYDCAFVEPKLERC